MKILNSVTSSSSSISRVTDSAKRHLSLFKEISIKLKLIESKFLNKPLITNTIKENFTLEMNSTIQFLLKNEEAALLLQGYDFLGFSLWNQKTNEILRRKNSEKSISFLEVEYERDLNFFYVLKNSIEFNITIFRKFSKEINAEQNLN